MAVKSLENGKEYRWIGPQNFDTNWNEIMNGVKDGLPHKFNGVNSMGNFDYEKNPDRDFTWFHVIQYFVKANGEQLEFKFE